jgi:glycosyltransferase involved in cell wall biosynthesis
MKKSSGIYFVMDPVSGGGPRNAFMLSGLLKNSGTESKVLSFKPLKPLEIVNRKKTQRTFFGADRLEPRFIFSVINSMIPGMENVNYSNYFFFLIHQNLLAPLTLFRYVTPDIYIATNWQSFRPTKVVARDRKIPMMYFVQADETEFSSNPIYKRHAMKTYINDVPKFTQSRWLVELLKEKFDAELEYIGLGIDHGVFYPRSENFSNTIFTIARTELTKGFPVFVKAINMLWEKRKDFNVIIAGYSEAVKREDISFPHKFIGWIHDDDTLAKLYSSSIFINTGINEALPMPPLEAMACGGTVVMTNAGGSVEYVNNKNCFVTNAGDPEELYQKLDLVLSSPEMRKDMRKEAFLTASKYTWDDVFKRFSALIRKEMGFR